MTNTINGSSDVRSNGHTNGIIGDISGHGSGHINGQAHSKIDRVNGTPVAICGMAIRLPGGIRNNRDLHDFLYHKGDAHSVVPEDRYNTEGYYSPEGLHGTINTKKVYFLRDLIYSNLDLFMFTFARIRFNELLESSEEIYDPVNYRCLACIMVCEDFCDTVDDFMKEKSWEDKSAVDEDNLTFVMLISKYEEQGDVLRSILNLMPRAGNMITERDEGQGWEALWLPMGEIATASTEIAETFRS